MYIVLSVDELRAKYKVDKNGFADFGDIARGEMHKQCQYASYYIFGDMPEYPNLGQGLRFENYEQAKNNYHCLRIHIDDVPVLMTRYIEHRKEKFGPFA